MRAVFVGGSSGLGLVVGCLLRTPPDGVVLSRLESLEAVDASAEADPDGA